MSGPEQGCSYEYARMLMWRCVFLTRAQHMHNQHPSAVYMRGQAES